MSDLPSPAPAALALAARSLDTLLPGGDDALAVFLDEILAARLGVAAPGDGRWARALGAWLGGDSPGTLPERFGGALLWTLRETLGEDFTPELEAAWRDICLRLDGPEDV